MNVTHAFRGEDHLTNTARQIMIFEALNLKQPKYGHIPLIMGMLLYLNEMAVVI